MSERGKTSQLNRLMALAEKISEQGGGSAVAPVMDDVKTLSEIRASGAERLGGLRGSVVIELQTRQSQLLLAGREPSPGKPQKILGLIEFSRFLTTLMMESRKDDPWADWYLIQVDEATEAAESYFNDMREAMQKLLQRTPSLKVSVSAVEKPVRIQLNFASSYAYWIARVITQYDELARMILTARHVAYISAHEERKMFDEASGKIRRIFAATSRYRYSGLTREDVAQMTEPARQATEKMGQVPEDVLNFSKRPRLASETARREMGSKSGAAQSSDLDSDAADSE